MCAHFALQLESEVVDTQQNRQELEQQCEDLWKVRGHDSLEGSGVSCVRVF